MQGAACVILHARTVPGSGPSNCSYGQGDAALGTDMSNAQIATFAKCELFPTAAIRVECGESQMRALCA